MFEEAEVFIRLFWVRLFWAFSGVVNSNLVSTSMWGPKSSCWASKAYNFVHQINRCCIKYVLGVLGGLFNYIFELCRPVYLVVNEVLLYCSSISFTVCRCILLKFEWNV